MYILPPPDEYVILVANRKGLNCEFDIVFNFEINDEILIKRIAGRYSCMKCGLVDNSYFNLPKKEGICDNCKSTQFENREDDNEHTVKNRLKVYHNSTVELIEYYKKKNLLCSIEAIESVPLVFDRLIEVVQNFSKY